MISYLKGYPAAIHQRGNSRKLLILEVQNIGYELQIPKRWAEIIQVNFDEPLIVYTHQQVRDDQIVLYGFPTIAERDLFRQLIAVSGIGAQMAIALLDTLSLTDLVQAIVTKNIRVLVRTPGVGKKTAERLVLELKTQLAEWRQTEPIPEGELSPLAMQIREDVELTLLAIGYTQREIQHALNVLLQDPSLQDETQPEAWIRSAIAWINEQENTG